jgi:hypothetical protein
MTPGTGQNHISSPDPAQMPSSTGDEPGIGGPEPATAEVERAEVVLEVDVEPLAPGRASVFRGDRNEARSARHCRTGRAIRR